MSAEARFALHAEIVAMTETQERQFHRLIIERAVAGARQLHEQRGFEDRRDVEAALSGAEQWLAEPSEEMAKSCAVFCAGERIDGGLRYYDYDPVFLAPADAVFSICQLHLKQEIPGFFPCWSAFQQVEALVDVEDLLTEARRIRSTSAQA